VCPTLQPPSAVLLTPKVQYSVRELFSQRKEKKRKEKKRKEKRYLRKNQSRKEKN
jgi:hypothetical protein